MLSHPLLGAFRPGDTVAGVAADGRRIVGAIVFCFGKIGFGAAATVRVGVRAVDAAPVFPEIHTFDLAALEPVAERSGR